MLDLQPQQLGLAFADALLHPPHHPLFHPAAAEDSFKAADVAHLFLLIKLLNCGPQLVFQSFGKGQYPVNEAEQFQNLRSLIAAPIKAVNQCDPWSVDAVDARARPAGNSGLGGDLCGPQFTPPECNGVTHDI
ncbi:MAG: hypothetical protein IPN92_19860 [Chromatiaceae bacterium]|nr:hypothetical protein [Chromatiaceae bacterium]